MELGQLDVRFYHVSKCAVRRHYRTLAAFALHKRHMGQRSRRRSARGSDAGSRLPGRRLWLPPNAHDNASATNGLTAIRGEDRGIAAARRVAVSTNGRAKWLQARRLRPSARRWVAEGHVRSAIAGSNGQRATRQRQRSAEGAERGCGELPQRAEAFELWGLVHDVSDGVHG